MNPNLAYTELVRSVLRGDKVRTRNADCLRIFGERIVFDRAPLVSVRQTAWKTALREMEGFIAGHCFLDEFHPSVQPWWKQQSHEKHGYMPNGYGEQFRSFRGFKPGDFDQIAYLVKGVTEHPFSRRNLITTWNTADMADESTIVTNCHGTVIHAFVNPDNSLHIVTYQRSADLIVGVPHNWIQYWAFLMWVAAVTGRAVGTLTWLGGDVHVYEQHVHLAQKITNLFSHVITSPGLVYQPSGDVFKADDFTLDGAYNPVLREKAAMVV